LTFSYLKQEYLARTVRGVLDQFPSDQETPAFQDLRIGVQAVAAGSVRLTHISVANLNDLAVRLEDWCSANRLTIIETAMNALGRWMFSDATTVNRKRVEKHLAYLLLGLEHHLGIKAFSRRMRERLSLHGYTDCASLKAACLTALEAARDDLLRIIDARCVFMAPDISMHTASMRMGDVAFLQWGTPELEGYLSPGARGALASDPKRTPYTAYLTVETRCHPDGLAEALNDAAVRIQVITGFLVSQSSGYYHPPRQYRALVFRPNELKLLPDHPSGVPQNSRLVVYPEKAPYFERLYMDYIAPALAAPVEPSLQERFRRALRCLRKASFAAGCGEWAQAYSSAWQAYEVVFGGNESRERGALISRRVAALSIGPDALRSDDTFLLTEKDLVQFCGAWTRGEVEGLNAEKELQELMSSVSVAGGADRGTIQFLQASFDSDNTDVLLRWKENQITEAAAQGSADQMQLEVKKRHGELRDRLVQCYKLRNDIVHAGYDYEPVAEEMYKEISGLFRSFVINLAFNCTAKRTYAVLLNSLDEEWMGPDHHVREKAYFYWLDRGSPTGDDWADWFRAEREVVDDA
jgi:hypothetical protein